MTQATLDDALLLVASKFKGMKDKAGQPYILHCLRVMLGVSDPAARIVALMHDLVEDTDVTAELLGTLGYAQEIVRAVELITHAQGISYAEYIVRLKPNELARQAKLADLRDNYSLDRVAYREDHREQDASRVQRYVLSYMFLTDKIDEVSYRRQMQLEI